MAIFKLSSILEKKSKARLNIRYSNYVFENNLLQGLFGQNAK